MNIRFGLRILTGVVALTSMGLAGCRVDTHRDGNNEDVKIATPFGGMSVKTDDNAIQAGVGLAVYPGATMVKKLHVKGNGDTEHDHGAADINMSFGSFHLGVKAVSYETADAPDKVLAFYRKDMSRYGQVIFCKGKHAVGSPSVTQDGLTCEESGKRSVHIDSGELDGTDGDLKAGSKQHQHIVSINSEGSRTKIGLVMLDLPGHIGLDDDDSKD